MKFLLIFILMSICISNGHAQLQNNNLPVNTKLLPQKIDYEGMPELEYKVNNSIIALDSYKENDSEGVYIRMKFYGKEVLLKMDKKNSSKNKRVYSNNEYSIIFFNIIYGDCSGQGGQYLTGKILIQTNKDQNTLNFKGSDGLYASKKCQDVGNG